MYELELFYLVGGIQIYLLHIILNNMKHILIMSEESDASTTYAFEPRM